MKAYEQGYIVHSSPNISTYIEHLFFSRGFTSLTCSNLFIMYLIKETSYVYEYTTRLPSTSSTMAYIEQ